MKLLGLVPLPKLKARGSLDNAYNLIMNARINLTWGNIHKLSERRINRELGKLARARGILSKEFLGIQETDYSLRTYKRIQNIGTSLRHIGYTNTKELFEHPDFHELYSFLSKLDNILENLVVVIEDQKLARISMDNEVKGSLNDVRNLVLKSLNIVNDGEYHTEKGSSRFEQNLFEAHKIVVKLHSKEDSFQETGNHYEEYLFQIARVLQGLVDNRYHADVGAVISTVKDLIKRIDYAMRVIGEEVVEIERELEQEKKELVH